PPASTGINVATWSQRSSVEEKGGKERDGVWCRASAAAGSRSDHLLVLNLGDGLDDGTLALDRGKRAAILIVDLPRALQFPFVVDERAVIAPAPADFRGLQVNMLLGSDEHLLPLLHRPVLAGTRDVEENLGIFRRILHTHAAVAVGSTLVGKHELLIR